MHEPDSHAHAFITKSSRPNGVAEVVRRERPMAIEVATGPSLGVVVIIAEALGP